VVTDKIPENRTYCSLCSRLRRGHLYRVAREEGCSALVLGHHREDILETFFMNLFHGGRLAAMPPKLVNDEGDVEVLRPLSYCAEADLEKFAKRWSSRSYPATSAARRTGCSATP
jgi:tRNA 2-thiocytidine biosynthesis protein TtcA